VIDSFEQEHVKDRELGTKLKTLIKIYHSLTGDEERMQLGSAMRKAFVEFLSFNLVHMAKEEDIINNLLWRYYTDEQIRGMERKIVAAQTPQVVSIVWKWMLRGLSNQEISGWLTNVEKNAPVAVFNNLVALAEKELPVFRFRQVIGGILQGEMA
jgi:hypothetical protein